MRKKHCIFVGGRCRERISQQQIKKSPQLFLVRITFQSDKHIGKVERVPCTLSVTFRFTRVYGYEFFGFVFGNVLIVSQVVQSLLLRCKYANEKEPGAID